MTPRKANHDGNYAPIGGDMVVRAMTLITIISIAAGRALGGPIHDAAMEGDVDKVKKLLDKDASLANEHDTDDHDCTPLHNAALFGKLEVMSLLLTRKADVNSKNDVGSTPLFKAAGADKDAAKVAELLFANGGKADVTNTLGKTPLHEAALVGNKALVSLLIEKGAKVDVKDNEGWTPLYEAAFANEKPDVIELLIDKKADVNAKTKIGWTPLDVAVAGKRNAVVEALRKHGGKSGKSR